MKTEDELTKDYLKKGDDILVDTLGEEKDLYTAKNIKMAQATTRGTLLRLQELCLSFDILKRLTDAKDV